MVFHISKPIRSVAATAADATKSNTRTGVEPQIPPLAAVAQQAPPRNSISVTPSSPNESQLAATTAGAQNPQQASVLQNSTPQV